jgi:hypothetical protein
VIARVHREHRAFRHVMNFLRKNKKTHIFIVI